jgi:trimeric autotransporter adhesin
MSSPARFSRAPLRRAITATVAVALATVLSASAASAALTVKLVKNINPGTADSSPSEFTKLGTKVLFAADDGSRGEELWKTDGTAAGTKLVKDINLGPDPSEPDDFVVLGSNVFFFADDGAHGRELWRSDGTAAGTRMVKDINTTVVSVGAAATEGSDGEDFIRVGSLLYFTANDGAHGHELWRSNGTTAGTRRLADVNPGSGDSNWCCMEVMGSTVLFQAFDGTDWGIWRTNGTMATTSKIVETGESPPNDILVVGNRFFFSLRVGNDGHLGISDGTPTGTQILIELAQVSYMAPLGSGIVFAGHETPTGNELYASDGTVEGTGLVLDIYPAEESSSPRFWSDTPLNGGVLFQAFTETDGYELWRTDGTEAGTRLVKDINPEGDSGDGSNYNEVVNGRLYFLADDGEHGVEPWVTDGTTAGTKLLKDIVPGAATSEATDGEVVGTFLYFTADTPAFGREIWRTNGTTASTRRVTDINPGPADTEVGRDEPIGNSLWFAAEGPNGEEPYRITQ